MLNLRLIFTLFFILEIKITYEYNINVPDKIIITADSNVLEMVENFYNEVILKFDVPNFSIIVWYKSSYIVYKQHNIPVENSPIPTEDITPTYNFDDPNLNRKLRLRNEIILYYLKQNLTILNMDSDLFFYRNPLELLKYINIDDDIVYQCDNPPLCNEMCYGLFYVKPSKPSIKLFERSVKMGKISSLIYKFGEQGRVNILLTSNRINALKYSSFPIDSFPHGNHYFNIYGKFVDDKNIRNVIGFHNTCTKGYSFKIYRFKELGVWKNDENEYYSSKTRKYIKYSTIIKSNNLNDYEKSMLYLMYLAKELNRTIIFPRFSNYYKNQTYYYNFINFWNLKYFEERYGLNYRENVFLLNELVPKEVKENVKEVCNENIDVMRLLNFYSVLSIHCLSNPIPDEIVDEYRYYLNIKGYFFNNQI